MEYDRGSKQERDRDRQTDRQASRTYRQTLGQKQESRDRKSVCVCVCVKHGQKVKIQESVKNLRQTIFLSMHKGCS